MPDHHNALPAGYRLGEYEIQAVLGSGGFGVTYKAHDHNLDKLVAIKEYLPPEFAVRDGRTTVKPKSSASKDDYAWGLDRFLDEARALARFDHTHINKVYRFFKDNGTAYLVLEYVEGDMLSELLKSKGRFNEAGVRRMLDELLDGLDKVHRAGYIHRDIKPANIIFRRDGSAVLLDFGAARQAIGKRSQMITSILTPGYAPVEQYLNTADAMGAWSDLYSLGICAYRCLIGGDESVVIDAPSRAHFLRKGEADKDMPAAVVVGKGKYSASLLSAIDWAMQVDEGERPQSVGELQVVLVGEGDVEVVAAAPVVKKAKKKVGKKVMKKDSVKSVSVKASAQTKGAEPLVSWEFVGAVTAVALVVLAIFLGVSGYQQRVADAAEAAWQNVDCGNESDVRAYLQEYYSDVRYRAAAERCMQQISAAAEAERQRKIAESNRQGPLEIQQAAFRRLVGRDASVWRVSDGGVTDLHFAARNGWAKLARWLIAYAADVDAQDNADWTPLHHAVFENAADVAKLLLANGADANAQNNYGATPMDLALSGGHNAMQSLLRQHGGQCNNFCQ